jgi:ribose transport system substrate-binding protein
MTVRPWLSLSGIALCAAGFVGCSAPAHAPEERYFLVAANVNVPYWQSAAAGLRKAASHLGVKADMAGPDRYDVQALAAEFRNAAAKNPSGILVSAADPDLLKPEIDAAIAKGIPVIAVDADSPGSKRLFFIGTDNYRAGVMGAELVVKKLSGKGSVAVYTMPGQVNLKDRLRGYQDVFANHPQIKIAEVIDVHGDPRVAFDRTMEAAKDGKSKFDAFVCLVSTSGPEVAEVLDRNRVQGKTVVAMDADPRTLDWVRKGVIAATVVQKPFSMAYVGLRMLDDLHHRKFAPLDGKWSENPFSQIPTFVDTGVTLVDQSNLDAYLAARDGANK